MRAVITRFIYCISYTGRSHGCQHINLATELPPRGPRSPPQPRRKGRPRDAWESPSLQAGCLGSFNRGLAPGQFAVKSFRVGASRAHRSAAAQAPRCGQEDGPGHGAAAASNRCTQRADR